ncbi:relaxase/mobilization nuclease domain-containing protein [Acutalibacter sp. 1XD8-33]|uniref:relaxase/mobilization nuclease domain-containing protein n=1 Tax=Acutalibacter sp. 1XD8-33 TaxID=2320081 RepID=UPI001FAACE9A|nr:relaxase/mobilization nuclease domain-containing protein [Acutalibacter sp. 1XD8-33]
MAVSKLWKVTERLGQVIDYATNPEKTANPEYSQEEYQALKDVLAYAKDEEKTEREFFCEGINCNVTTARDQFITVKEQYGKTDGIQAYHGYLSFKENEVTPEQAQQIGMEFANKMWGERFQVVVTTHLNTKHLHCHFVINSVSFADGKRLQNKEKSWYYFRHIADEICLEHKISIVENPKLHQSPKYLTKKDEAGMPTRYNNARKAIDEAIAMSHNLKQFQYELSVMGYHSNLSPNRKYATIIPKGGEKPI